MSTGDGFEKKRRRVKSLSKMFWRRNYRVDTVAARRRPQLRKANEIEDWSAVVKLQHNATQQCVNDNETARLVSNSI